LSRNVRRVALSHIPGIRAMRLGHVLWMQRQNERYGALAYSGWQFGFGLWRLVRALINPLQAAGQETSGAMLEKTAKVLSLRIRAYATRLLVLEVGRAAIDLYSGRLSLSEDEMRSAQERDTAGPETEPMVPIRILLVGQVSAGKSSLVNGLAREVRCAIGPLPTTARVTEYPLILEGRPAVTLVDMPGVDDRAAPAAELLAQAARADLILWVASATQPAREPDPVGLAALRSWSQAQLVRRPPPVLLALTHVDELRPAAEWSPPYDITAPTGPKARSIRDAMDAVGRTLALPAEAIVPVAMPRAREPYNMDALWARVAVELDEAKLVQL